MIRDFRCDKKACRAELLDYKCDVLSPWPKCPKCGGRMNDISWKTAKVAIRGKGYTKEGIR